MHLPALFARWQLPFAGLLVADCHTASPPPVYHPVFVAVPDVPVAFAPTSAVLSVQIPLAEPFTLSSQPTPAAQVDVLAEIHDSFGRYVYDSVHATNALVSDVFVTSDGHAMHCRLQGQPSHGGPGVVTVTFGSEAGTRPVTASTSFVVRADGTIALSTGAVTSPQGFYSGPVTLVRRLVLSTSAEARLLALRVGEDLSAGELLRIRWRPLYFHGVLDRAVVDRRHATVTATTDGGSVTVGQQSFSGDEPMWPVTYDPRDAHGRLAAGPHVVRMTWSVPSRGAPRMITAETTVTVRDDGSVTVPIVALADAVQ